jgi:hypothetical protein
MANEKISDLTAAATLTAADLAELEQPGETAGTRSRKITMALLRVFFNAPAVQSVTSAGTVTPTFDNDMVKVTAQAAALAWANPTGTAKEGWGWVLRWKDNGSARAVSFDTQYRAADGVTLPTTTVVGKTHYAACIWNATDTKVDVIAVGFMP